MAMLPPDTMLLTPLVLSISPRGLLMLIPSMVMDMDMDMPAPSPLVSPPSPPLASHSRDMPMDIMAMVCGRGDSSNSLATVWTGCSILSVLSGAQARTAGQNAIDMRIKLL